MLFSEADGHKVVSTSTAESVGKVAGFLVDAGSRAVAAVKVKKAPAGDSLAWADIVGFGADAVTVADAAAITAAPSYLAELDDKAHRLLGKRVLSAGGDELGSVSDIDFDVGSGTLTELVMADQTVAAHRLLGVGSYAVVVAAD